MISKIYLYFSILLFCLVLCSIPVNAEIEGAPRIYPMPRAEVEDVLKERLSCMGFEISRSIHENDTIQLYAVKADKIWTIRLQQKSPLATKLWVLYTVDGHADQTEMNKLMNHLGGCITEIAVPNEESADYVIPAAVLSQIESVVCINAQMNSDSVQYSGFVVDKQGLVLCTAHYLKNPDTITVTLFDGSERKGRLIRLDYLKDLALIDVDYRFGSSIALANSRELLSMGQQLYSIGCPDDLRGTIYPGFVNGPPRLVDEQPLWQVQMKIHPGSSGSPVFDVQGNLAAIVKGRLRGGDSLGFLIPLETIIAFVKDM